MFRDNIWSNSQQQTDYRRSEFDANKLRTAISWLSTQPVEHMLVAFYNPRSNLIAIEELARGGRHSVSFDLDDIFRRCVMLSAKGCMVIHNHPEGGSKPSREDIAFTKRMISRGATLDIHLLDSMIVDDLGNCTSLRQSKIIDPWYPQRPWAHHGPAIARALLDLDRTLASQSDDIRRFVEGPGIKLLLALYLHHSAQPVHEISIATTLSRATTARVLKGLLQIGLVTAVGSTSGPRHQKFKLSEDGFSVTECLLSGGEVSRLSITGA